ncbi:mucin-5AC [Aplysia californica]|uniref:Mucin-5AC n=1 Tax=Aplysia californica TaxID=6500 RepID=A0ABM1A6R7_APLCA|nr:mucin-5AC [Aplysia californica]
MNNPQGHFMGYDATKVPVQQPNQCTPVTQASVSQTGFMNPSVLNQGQPINDSMGSNLVTSLSGFQTQNSLQNPSNVPAGLSSIEPTSFPQLDLGAVVSGGFSIETSTPSASQGDNGLNSSAIDSVYNSLQYSNAAASETETAMDFNLTSSADYSSTSQVTTEASSHQRQSFAQSAQNTAQVLPTSSFTPRTVVDSNFAYKSMGFSHVAVNNNQESIVLSNFNNVQQTVQQESGNYPQPMQIQEQDFTAKAETMKTSFPSYPSAGLGTSSSSAESAMDITSGHSSGGIQNQSLQDQMGTHSSNIIQSQSIQGQLAAHNSSVIQNQSIQEQSKDSLPSGMSFEEIHRFIVKAGDELSRKSSNPDLSQQKTIFTNQTAPNVTGLPVSDFNQTVATSVPQSTYSSPTIVGNQLAEKQVISLSAIQTPGMIALSHAPGVTSTTYSSPQSIIHHATLGELGAYDQDRVPVLQQVAPSSGMTNSQPLFNSSEAQVHQSVPSNNNIVASVPNFLENPTVVSCIRSSHPDNASLIPPAHIAPGQPGQTRFVVTMIAASPANSRPVVASSGTNQPKVTARPNMGIASNQQQVLGSVNATAIPAALSQILNSVVNLPLPTSTSVLTASPQVGIACLNSTTQTSSSISASIPHMATVPGLSFIRAASNPVSSASMVIQMPAPQAQLTNAVLSSTVAQAATKAPDALTPAPPANQGLSGMAAVVISKANNPASASSPHTSQPHIIMSLEDLQKLLSQQSIAQSAQTPRPITLPSAPAVQSHVVMGTGSTSQTALPKPVPLRPAVLQQPRLLIQSSALPSRPRLMHPHQQLQQTREQLQMIVQQAHQTQTFPTTLPAHKAQEQAILFAAQEKQQKVETSVQLVAIQKEKLQQEHSQQKVHIVQQTHVMEHESAAAPLQLQSQVLQQQQQLQQAVQNLIIQHQQQETVVTTEQKVTQQQLQQAQSFVQDQQMRHAQTIVQLAQMQQELQQAQGQQKKEPEQEEHCLSQPAQLPAAAPVQAVPVVEKGTERQCSDSLKKDYKHLHSLLTRENPALAVTTTVEKVPVQKTVLPPVLSFPSNHQEHVGLVQQSGAVTTSAEGLKNSSAVPVPVSSAPFTFLPSGSAKSFPAASAFTFTSSATAQPVSSSAFSFLTSSTSMTSTVPAVSIAPLTTLSFGNSFSTAEGKMFDFKELKLENMTSPPSSAVPKVSNDCFIPPASENPVLETSSEAALSKQASLLAQILTEKKRSDSPLSVDLSSPANSNSEAPSPLSSPNPFEDANTQATLIERSADLQIRSDTMHGIEDEENASFFDISSFNKRPSADDTISFKAHNATREKDDRVPMKIAKSSLDAEAHSSVPPSSSPDPTFDIGSVVSSTSSFTFGFGSKEDNATEVFTFGSSTPASATTESVPVVAKAGGKASRPSVPTQPVRPTSRKQKDHSLKGYFSSKLDNMELKIVEQPETQHRARYQTEGSRGAIKDASQQGFPVIKLCNYNKETKLQVFIGDESGRVKPHGFYQACRVFGKTSTPCTEQEIEGTAVIEIEMLPENDMTVKLDCIGILKLRNADVERRIGPKRARDKKKNNTKARLVMRTAVEKADGSQHILQVVSHPIVCTQPVGQPEISRMSLSECSIEGGESLFIIGKNFKNRGTSVLFQKLDGNDDKLIWQAEAEIEQEFFQPTHLICKVPPYKEKLIEKPQVTQIVVSCAGKKSDPHNFTYKPVYPVAPPVKQEVPLEKHEMPMETDQAAPSRPLPFVSPEALHLNRMVHQTHALAPTSTSMFQLPPGTIPTISGSTPVRSPPTPSSSPLIKPARLFGSPSSTSSVASPPTHTAVASSSSSSSKPTQGQDAVTSPVTTLPTFLLEERPDGLVSHQAQSMNAPVTLSTPAVHCVVHSNSEGSSAPSTGSYAVSGAALSQPVVAASGSSQPVTDQDAVAQASALTSKPIVVVFDPSSLQADANGGQIKQLLQQILEAQKK